MAIYEPQIALTETDREALALLAYLVLATADDKGGHNLGGEAAPVSLAQASQLIPLLEDLFASKRFVEGCYFVEGIAGGQGWHDPRLREIYLSSRKRLGFTRVASTYTWNDFVVRAGFSTDQNAWLWPRSGGVRTVPMEFEHFLKMEGKLADAAGLHPRVKSLIIEFLASRATQIQMVRNHKLSVLRGTTQSFARNFLKDLKRVVTGKEKRPITKRKLIAVSTLVMDVGTLFITRDWTATGTMSMIGAALPDSVE